MSRRLRYLALSLCLVFGLSTAAYAWVVWVAPLASGVMWLGRWAAANTTMARAIEWSIYTHGAVFTYLTWRNAFESDQTANGHLEATLDPLDPRKNPDPQKWDDPAPGQRDPTPKVTIPQAQSQASQQEPDTIQKVVADLGYQDNSKYYKKDANTDVLYTIQKTTTCPTSGGAVLSGYTYAGCVPTSTQPVPTPYSALVANINQDVGIPGSKCFTYNASTDTCYVVTPVMSCTGYAGLAPTGYSAAACSNWNTPANSYAWTGNGQTSTAAVYVKSQAPGAFLVFKKELSVACPPGYVSANGACQLSDISQVKKPAGALPCELRVNQNGTFDIDTSNPSCTSLQGDGKLVCNGATCTYTRGAGDYDQITKNSDGTGVISTRGPNGNRDITTGPPGPAGTPITGTTDLPGPTPPPGGGGGGGGGGTAGGTCGGPNQPKCYVSVDDGSFQGREGEINGRADAAAGKLDGREDKLKYSEHKGKFDLDETWSWMPKLRPGGDDYVVPCRPIEWKVGFSTANASVSNHTEEIDLCNLPAIQLIREYYSWLIWFLTVIGIAMLFFNSNGNASTRGK